MKYKLLILVHIALVSSCKAEPSENSSSGTTPLTHVSAESTTVSDLKKIQIINKMIMTNNFLELDQALLLTSLIEKLKAAGLDAEIVEGIPTTNRVFALEHSNRRIGNQSAVYFRFRLKHLEILPIQRGNKTIYGACETWMVEQGGSTAIDKVAELFPTAIASVADALADEMRAGAKTPLVEIKR